MTKLKVAVVQEPSRGRDTLATAERAAELIAQCAADGIRVVVFPEAFLGGYPKGADFGVTVGNRTPEGRAAFQRYHDAAIDLPGRESALIAEACAAGGLYATVGVIERDGGTLYCTAVFFGPDGTILGKHRKLMPTAAERLCWGFGDGSTMRTVDTPFGPMGAVICWENYMPLMRMAMYEQGIALYCAPTADDRDSWVATMQHVALEGRCFVLSACQFLTEADLPDDMQSRPAAKEGEVLMRGGSLIVDPLGRIVAGPDYSGATILSAEIDMRDIARAKFDFDVVGHYARPDVFSMTVDERPRAVVTRLAEPARKA